MKRVSFLAALLLLFSALTVRAEIVASGFCGADPNPDDGIKEYGKNLSWTLTDDGVFTITGSGEMYGGFGSLNEKLTDLPWDDQLSYIETVIISGGVTSIGGWAFYGCTSLAEVTIPEGVTRIGTKTFSGCTSLAKVTIPEGVTWIGTETFSGCTSLAKVTISGSVTKIGGAAFYGCTSLADVTIPEGVTRIETETFYGCTSLSEVTIPESVTEIGLNVFSGCDNLKILNYNAADCQFDDIDDIGEGWTAIETLNIGDSVKIIHDYTFSGCTGLTELTIPEGVESIGARAFKDCSGLTELTLGENVAEIGLVAFSGCDNIKTLNYNAADCKIDMAVWGTSPYPDWRSISTLNIGSTVKVIPEDAFRFCNGLTEVIIPEGVTEIGDYAFSRCTSLAEVTIPENVTKMGFRAFYGCSNLKTLNYNAADCQSVSYKGAQWTAIETLNIGENVKAINMGAFYGCTSLTEVTIPGSVTKIGNYAFCGCTGLTEVIIPEGVTEIGYDAFQGCSSLSSITVPESVTSIVSGVFAGCSSLVSVLIPEGVTIEDSPFRDDLVAASDEYPLLESLIIRSDIDFDGEILDFAASPLLRRLEAPASVFNNGRDDVGFTQLPIDSAIVSLGTIDYRGFESLNLCRNTLRHIDLSAAENTELPAEALSNCFMAETILLPSGLERIDSSAFSGCKSLKSIDIPASVTEIADSAFKDCISLSSINFGGTEGSTAEAGRASAPASQIELRRIGNWAFYNCHQLPHLVIPEGVTEIGDSAFFGCTQLSDITLSASVQKLSNGAFKRCGDSLMVRSYSIEPPEIITAFDTGIYTYLKVPCEGVDLYRADSAWTDYFNTNHIAGIEVPQITLIADREYGYAEISVPVDCESHKVTVNAISNDNSRFICWRNTDDEVVTQANPYTFIVTSDTTLVAEFIRLVNVDLQPNDADKGRVEGGGTYDVGEQVEITAVPNNHFEFVRWSDGNTDNPRIITVTSDTSLQAIFDIRKYTVTLDVNDETMGMVFGDGEYEYGKSITVIAKPNDGYAFEKWSDEETKSVRLIKVNEDISLTAYFRPDDTATDGASITDFVRISSDGTLHIEGYDGKRMAVYTSDGALFYAGEIKELYLPVPGVYILRIGGETVKVVRP